MPLLRPPLQILLGALALAVLGACGSDSGGPKMREDARVRAIYRLTQPRPIIIDAGARIREGGFSALDIAPDGGIWTTTDRGPNLEAAERYRRPAKRFPNPRYHPHALRLDTSGGQLVTIGKLPFELPEGLLATGLPTPPNDTLQVVEMAIGFEGNREKEDPRGIDSEGLAIGSGNQMYVCDEYRPSIWLVDTARGLLTQRYTPKPSEPYERKLPEWLLQRRANLGIEGLAYDGSYLYAALQGPLSPPDGSELTPFARILRIDLGTEEVSYLNYELDGPARKIGDLSMDPSGEILVLEHGENAAGQWSAEIFALDLDAEVWNAEGVPGAEAFTNAQAARDAGRSIAGKHLYVDLVAAGWPREWLKPEGLAVAANGDILLVNDNDYGIDSPAGDGVSVQTGVMTGLVVIR